MEPEQGASAAASDHRERLEERNHLERADDEDETGPSGVRPSVEALREQNSKAQKRYRERQKLHKQKLQQDLDELRSKAAKLCAAQKERAHLEMCAIELAKQLKSQQAEITLLQQTISASMSRNPSVLQGREAGEIGSSSSSSGTQIVEAVVGEVRSEQGSMLEGAVLEVSQLQLRWVQQIYKIGLALATSNLDEATMLALIDEVCTMFVELNAQIPKQADALLGNAVLGALARPHTASLWGKRLLHTSLSAWGAFTSQKHVLRWKHVAMALNLTPLQCNQVLQLRCTALAELEKCFIDRKSLHSQLQLLESKWKVNMQTVRTTEAKLVLLQMNGQEGIELLDKVKKNLLGERSVYLSLNNECMLKVLLPTNLAKLMTECAPEQADVMMLASVYAGQVGAPYSHYDQVAGEMSLVPPI